MPFFLTIRLIVLSIFYFLEAHQDLATDMSAQCPDLEGLRFQCYAYNATTGVRKPHESTLCVLVTPDPVPQPAQMMHDVFTFEKMVKHMLGQFLH